MTQDRELSPGESSIASGELDRGAYFQAAYRILSERGFEHVTISALCEQLYVTKGSFYHHFRDLDDFLGSFADHWKSSLEQIFAGFAAEADLRRRLELFANGHVSFQLGAEPAIRAWAGAEPAVAVHLEDLHRRADDLGAATFGAVVGDERLGRLLATVLVLMHVGIQQRPERTPRGRLLLVMKEWYSRFLGLQTGLVPGPAGGPSLSVAEWRVDGNRVPAAPAAQRPIAQTRQTVTAGRESCARAVGTSPADQPRREAYLAAARSLLAQSGPSSLTSAALCAALAVTRGSFQHQYGNLENFQREFAAHLVRTAGDQANRYTAAASPRTTLAMWLREELLCERHPDAAPVREWGWSNPAISAALRRVDQAQLALLTRMLRDNRLAAGQEGVVADMTYGLAVGLQQRGRTLAADARSRIVELWISCCLGVSCRVTMVEGTPTLSLGA